MFKFRPKRYGISQSLRQLQILLYEECSGVTPDLKLRMVTLYTFIVVLPKLIKKCQQVQVVYLLVLHFTCQNHTNSSYDQQVISEKAWTCEKTLLRVPCLKGKDRASIPPFFVIRSLVTTISSIE